MISKRTLISLEKKIGQANLADSLGVSPSTIRRWKRKKSKHVPKNYHKKLDTYRQVLKHTRPTKKQSLKNKRFEKIIRLKSIDFFQYTKTANISAIAYSDKEVPGIIDYLSKKRIGKNKVEYFWITVVGENESGEEIFISTNAFPYPEIKDVWWTELDLIIQTGQSGQLVFISHFIVNGKAFQM